MSKIFTVFGATGNQGGSVARHVLTTPELSKIYKVRAVTRDTTKPAAQKLRDMGAELVTADMNDPASLRAAMKGADTVWGVTNFWEGMDAAAELRQGKAMADAAVAEGVDFFIFSSLPNVTRVTNGKLSHVTHFDQKALVEEYVRTLPIKSAFFWAAFFMQNFLDSMAPKKNDDGTYTLASVWGPDDRFPIIDISDTGKFVAPLLRDRDGWNGGRMYGAGGFYSANELAATWSKVTGKTVNYMQIPDEVFKSFLPDNLAQEMLENMILMREYQYFGPEGKGPEAELDHCLSKLDGNDKPATFEQFVAKNKWFE